MNKMSKLYGLSEGKDLKGAPHIMFPSANQHLHDDMKQQKHLSKTIGVTADIPNALCDNVLMLLFKTSNLLCHS